MTVEEIDEQIRIERMNDLICSRTSEAVRVGERFYCVQCHAKDASHHTTATAKKRNK